MAKFKLTLLNRVTIHEKVPFRINLLWLGYVSGVYCLLVQFVDFIILSLSHPVYTCLYIFLNHLYVGAYIMPISVLFPIRIPRSENILLQIHRLMIFYLICIPYSNFLIISIKCFIAILKFFGVGSRPGSFVKLSCRVLGVF